MYHRNNFTVILDFMGVVGDLDYVKLVMDLPTKQKFSALRVFLTLLKTPKLKNVLKQYQSGKISRETVQAVVSQYLPRASYIIPILLDKIPDYIKVNSQVLDYAKEIRNNGGRVYILSNTIPETEDFINGLDLSEVCDDVVCSTDINMIKPHKEIYEYMISTYNLSPYQTIFIDDSAKNTKAAELCGLQVYNVANSEETCDILESYVDALTTFPNITANDIRI